MKKYVFFIALCAVTSMQGMLKQSLRMMQTKRVVGLVQQRNFKNNLYVMHEGRYTDNQKIRDLHEIQAKQMLKSLESNMQVIATHNYSPEKTLKALESVVAAMTEVKKKQEQAIADLCNNNIEDLQKKIGELDPSSALYKGLYAIFKHVCSPCTENLSNPQLTQFQLDQDHLMTALNHMFYDNYEPQLGEALLVEIFKMLLPFVTNINAGICSWTLRFAGGGMVELGERTSCLLHQAARRGQSEIVALLLEREDLNVNVSDYDDEFDLYKTALSLAAVNGHADIVKMLLSDPRIDPKVVSLARKCCRRNRRLIAIFDEFEIKEKNRKKLP